VVNPPIASTIDAQGGTKLTGNPTRMGQFQLAVSLPHADSPRSPDKAHPGTAMLRP